MQLIDWRGRAAARLMALALCAGLFAILVFVSRTFAPVEEPAAGVEAVIVERLPPHHERERRRQAETRRTAEAPPMPSELAPSIEAEMLTRMLRCVIRPGQPRPPDCPAEPEDELWRSPRVTTGGVFAPAPQPDMNRIYTRAEQATLVTPSCVRDGTHQVCIPIGVRPPPPARSPEQICQDENLGGPCAPAPGM